MTIPFSCASKMWIGVFFTFSAVFQVSVNGAAMSSGLESNCSMQSEVAACASICNQERATCLEFVSISTCACKSTPKEGQYRCEKGDEVEGSIESDFPSIMEKCEKLARSYSDVDYYLCSPKYRRNSDFMCVIQDRSEEEHDIVKRKVTDDKETGDTDDSKFGIKDLVAKAVNLIPESVKTSLNIFISAFTEISNKITGALKTIKTTLAELVEKFLSFKGTGDSSKGSRRRRAITEL